MPASPELYLAVIGDLVASKAIRDRAAFQAKLRRKLAELSSSESVLSPFTLTLGDQFQALFQSGRGLFQSLFEIRALLHPVACRFALSVGQLSTAVNREQAIGMDGPVFHSARQGIEQLKKTGDGFVLSGLSRPMRALVDPAARLLWAGTDSWNANRLEIMARLLTGQTEKEMAKALAISERAVYKNIHDARLDEWTRLIESVEARLTLLLKPDPPAPC